MGGWRGDIAIIRELITAAPSGGWRGDIAGIAAALGMNPTGGWRENLRYIRDNITPTELVLWDDTRLWDDTDMWNDGVVV